MVAVRVGREVAGHLILSAEDELGSIDRALIDVATTGVALEFAKLRAAVEVEERLRGEATADLLNGTYSSEESISRRAARLGHDLGQPHALLVIDVALEDDAGDAEPWGDPDRQRRLLALVRDRLATRAPRSLAAVHAGSIVVLATRPRRGERDVRQLAEDLRSCLEAATEPGAVTVAEGGACHRPDDYARALGQAREAIDVMVKLGRRGSILGARELGPF